MTKIKVSATKAMELQSALKNWMRQNVLPEDFRNVKHGTFQEIPAYIDYSCGTASPNPVFSSKDELIDSLSNYEANYEEVSLAYVKIMSAIQLSNSVTMVTFDCKEHTVSELLLLKDHYSRLFNNKNSERKYANYISNAVQNIRKDGQIVDVFSQYSYKEYASQITALENIVSNITIILSETNSVTMIELDEEWVNVLSNLK